MDTIEVSAAVLVRGGKLLITQRRAGDPLEHLWEFPGGKREPGETFEACVERELSEELGLRVQAGPLIETVIHAYPERRVHLRFYKCRWIEHEPRALACQDFAWITREELAGFDFPEADAQLIERLRVHSEIWED